MKFNFKIQQYQTDAVDSVVKVFNGQPFQELGSYRRDIGNIAQVQTYSQMTFSTDGFGGEQQTLMFTDDFDESGFRNEQVLLSKEQLLRNIHDVQQQNNVKLSDTLVGDLGCCSLDVEMETGTGKTYVYIKTMYELNKHYGWSKFIVVVPSIAIREGVAKSLRLLKITLWGNMERRFALLYITAVNLMI